MKYFLFAAMTMIAAGCVEEVKQQPQVVSSVPSNESIEAVKKGNILIDRAGEELPTLMDLKEISFTEEIRQKNSFTVRVNRTDFDAVRSDICKFESVVQKEGGEIQIQQLVKGAESPYIKVRFPEKKPTAIVAP